jgi:hypothetical protein
MFDLEFHRDRHITRRDRQALALSIEAAHATVSVAGAPEPRSSA